jgi:hypothetical protein
MNSKQIPMMATLVIILLAGLYTFHHLTREPARVSQDQFNPFLIAIQEDKKIKSESGYYFVSPFDLRGPLISVYGNQLNVEGLPVDVQHRIFQAQMMAYQNVKAILQEFSLRLSIVASEIGIDNVDVDNLPNLADFYGSYIKDEELDQIYEENKHAFPDDHNPGLVKEAMRAELLYMRLSDYLPQRTRELVEYDILALLAIPPRLPLFSVNLNDYYVLRTGDDRRKVFLISGYFCEGCRQIFRELGEIFQKDDLKMDFIFTPYTDDFDSPEGVAYHVSECLYELDRNEYWKYYFKLMNLPSEQLQSFPDQLEGLYSYFRGLANDLNIDQRRLAQCADMNNQTSLAAIVRKNHKIKTLALHEGPIMFINDLYYDAIMYKDLRTAIERLTLPKGRSED